MDQRDGENQTMRCVGQVSRFATFEPMSQFVVSARKFRPLRFDEVVGQEHVTATLKNALISDHLAHAFLFCGPRGVGKTSCARILAKALNCENPSEDREPCNTCKSCTSFNEMASFNIIELDAASNNRVEHIRALNEQVRFRPQEGQYKVFIIDEVHMLTTQAFNAFLKTLEEPPSYAVFILATTEKHKILPTILSRCQIYDFHRIGVTDIAGHLASIADKEHIKYEDEALRLVASKADGALRDALSLFDRIATVSDAGLTYDQVIEQLNILDYDYFFRFVDAFINENIEQVFILFDEVLSNGFDGDLFLVGLGEHFRQLLMAKTPQTISLIEGGERLVERYKEQATEADMTLIMTALSLINDCDINYPRAKNKRLHVEICLSRICYLKKAVNGVELVGGQSGAEKKKIVPPKTTQESKPTQSTMSPSIKAKIVESTPKVPESQSVKSKLKTKVKVPTVVPKIASISDIKQEVIKENQALENTEIIELTRTTLLSEWTNFIDKIPTQSLKKIFQMSEISLSENGDVQISVASSIAKDGILQESEFVQGLRTKYNRPGLKMKVVIDEEKAQAIKDQNTKPATFMDKYKTMVEKNPNLSELVQRFQLKPDND